MAGVKLDAVAQEKALAPGSLVEIEYDLAFENPYLIGLWLKDVEADLEKQAPLWTYKNYTWDPDNKRIVFRLELGNYVSDLDTGKIVPQWLDGTFKEPVTKYYASAASITAMVGVSAMAVAGFTWLIVREVRLVEVLNDPDLTAEQKRQSVDEFNKGPLADAGQVIDKVGVGVVVALIVAAIVGAKR